MQCSRGPNRDSREQKVKLESTFADVLYTHIYILLTLGAAAVATCRPARNAISYRAFFRELESARGVRAAQKAAAPYIC